MEILEKSIFFWLFTTETMEFSKYSSFFISCTQHNLFLLLHWNEGVPSNLNYSLLVRRWLVSQSLIRLNDWRRLFPLLPKNVVTKNEYSWSPKYCICFLFTKFLAYFNLVNPFHFIYWYFIQNLWEIFDATKSLESYPKYGIVHKMPIIAIIARSLIAATDNFLYAKGFKLHQFDTSLVSGKKGWIKIWRHVVLEEMQS